MKIPVAAVLPNPDQPRTVFNPDELQALAASIRENGLIQNIAVEQHDDQYILIDGERRWRAHQLLGWTEIDAELKPSQNGGKDRMTRALVANVQRSAMGPVDEAKAYQKLVEELGTSAAAAAKVGVSEGIVSMRLSLLEFDETVQKLFNMKKVALDGSVIAALKRLKPDQQARIVAIAATRGWSSESLRKACNREQKKSRKSYVPVRRTARIYEPVGAHFDALALTTNHKKLPLSMLDATRKTCEACSLYDEANAIICKQCPLPDFLNRWQPTKQ